MTYINTNNSFTNSLQAVSTKVTQSAEQYDKDKEAFLKLLMVQLKNQDPTKPLETNELSQQLMTMGAVEQQINTNKLLEMLVASNQYGKLDRTASYIGQEVEFDYSKIEVVPESPTKIVYNLAEDALNNKIEVVNTKGEVVHTVKGETGKGYHEFYWDGKNEKNLPVEAGTYNIRITAKNSDGLAIAANSVTRGLVKSVKLLNGEALLVLDQGQDMKLDKITAVYEGPKEDLNHYLNKIVEFDNSKVQWNGESNVAFNFSLPTAQNIAFANVLDATGKIIYTKPLHHIAAGVHQMNWNGRDNQSKIQLPGQYRLSVVDQFNKPIPKANIARGLVTSVGTGTNGNSTLTINDHIEITSKDILSTVSNADKNDNMEQLRAHVKSLYENNVN